VVDQPATTPPELHEQAPVVPLPRVTTTPTDIEHTPVNNSVSTATASATTTPSPTPSPTPSATSTPQPTATATPKPTEPPAPQVAEAPVQTDSASNKKPDANNDGNSGQNPQQKQKKKSADSGSQPNDNAQAGNAPNDASQPVAESGANDNANQRKNRGFGATQNVTNAPDSSQPPVVNESNSNTSSGQDADESNPHRKKHGRSG
jgi:hypothetical protein